MRIISLTPEGENNDAAFDREKMRGYEIDQFELLEGLRSSLGPISVLLNDGMGVCVIKEGESAQIIGIDLEKIETEND